MEQLNAKGGLADKFKENLKVKLKAFGAEKLQTQKEIKAEEERVVARVPTTYLGYLAPDDSEFAPSNTGEDSASDADADSDDRHTPSNQRWQHYKKFMATDLNSIKFL